MNKVPMTIHGAEKMRDELKHLTSVERPQIIAAIAEARGHGDLKENAEYHAAKERQGFIESRIRHLEGLISNAQVIDVAQLPKTGKIVFGVTIKLVNLETDVEVSYQIVGEDEADIKQGKISISAPIARAVIGKEEGDIIHVQTPGGVVEYEILKVEYI